MANRYPLVIDTTNGNNFAELPEGDNLLMTNSSIVNVLNISAVGNIAADTLEVNGVSVTGSYNDLTDKPDIPQTLTDLGIADGLAGYILQANGDGTFSFVSRQAANVGNFQFTDNVMTVASGETEIRSPSNLVLYPTDNIWISAGTKLIFEGTVPDNFEAKLQATTVTADRDIILPDENGTIATREWVNSQNFGTVIVDWTNIQNTPTTLSGYGITDPAVLSDSSIAAQPVRQYYLNTTEFPSASEWHGAIAHSHDDNAMYFAHGGTWNRLANASELSSQGPSGDLQGSVFGDDSALLVDGVNSKIVGPVETSLLRTSEDYIRLGENAGAINQGRWSVAIGQNAGYTNQGGSSVAIGEWAGVTDQGSDAVAIGQNAGEINQNTYAVAVGEYAGNLDQGLVAVAVGHQAGGIRQGNNSVAIGQYAGNEDQTQDSVAVGSFAGYFQQGLQGVAIGLGTAEYSQGKDGIALGLWAGRSSQGEGSIAIGREAGRYSQGTKAIAIGYEAGGSVTTSTNQGDYSIAIGNLAGANSCPAHSIILNASEPGNIGALNVSTGNYGFYVNPVRNNATTNFLYYDTETKEITYGSAAGGTANAFLTFDADVGSTTADIPADALTIAGGTDISTTIIGDTLTIDYTGTGGGASRLGDLLDVDFSTLPADGDVLTYDATAGAWIPQLPATGGGSQNLFANIAVAGQTTVSADTTTDTLTLVAGTGITLTTDAAADSITIAATGGGGTYDQPLNTTDDVTFNSVTSTTTVTANDFVSTGTGIPTITSASNIILDAANTVVIQGSPVRLSVYTTAEATALAAQAGDTIYVSDGDAGSPCLAVHDGTSWKRVSLGATISSV